MPVRPDAPRVGQTKVIDGVEHIGTLISMARLRTIVARDLIIQRFVFGGPIQRWTKDDCELFLRNPGNDWEGKADELNLYRMLVKLKLMLAGEVYAGELEDVTAFWGKPEGMEHEQEIVRMKKKHWLRAQIAFQPCYAFMGTLSFDGDVIGHGWLTAAPGGIGLETDEPQHGWQGKKTGTLKWDPDLKQPPDTVVSSKQLLPVDLSRVKPKDAKRLTIMILRRLMARGLAEVFEKDEPKGWTSGPYDAQPEAEA